MIEGFALPSWDLTVRLISATVQIDQSQGDGTRTVGTGFLVNAPTIEGTPRVVLVTAGHVLDRMPAENARVGWRFEADDGAWRYAPQPLKIREVDRPLWTRHPTQDIAVMSITAPDTFARAAIPLSWLADETTFARDQVGPGDEMMALGFPRGLSANRAGFPILRVGRVASYPLTPVSAFPTFLLDFTVFPGNSGGPVFVNRPLETGPVLQASTGGAAAEQGFIAGLLTQQVELNNERLEIGIVTHAKYIRETIDMLGAPLTPSIVTEIEPPPTVQGARTASAEEAAARN